MKILHKKYDHGVQSIQLRTEDDVPLVSVGVMFPGTYDFGVAEHKEVVKVTMGQMTINNVMYSHGDHRVCEIQVGEPVKISCVNYATWQTLFGNFGREGL